MIVDLGVHTTYLYEQEFEGNFLQLTKEYYCAESQMFLDQNTCSDYLKMVINIQRNYYLHIIHSINYY